MVKNVLLRRYCLPKENDIWTGTPVSLVESLLWVLSPETCGFPRFHDINQANQWCFLTGKLIFIFYNNMFISTFYSQHKQKIFI